MWLYNKDTAAAYKFLASTASGQLLGRSYLVLCHELRLVRILWNPQATSLHALTVVTHTDARPDTKKTLEAWYLL